MEKVSRDTVMDLNLIKKKPCNLFSRRISGQVANTHNICFVDFCLGS